MARNDRLRTNDGPRVAARAFLCADLTSSTTPHGNHPDTTPGNGPVPLHSIAILPGTESSARSSQIGHPFSGPSLSAAARIRQRTPKVFAELITCTAQTTHAGTRNHRAGIQQGCLICVLKKAQRLRGSQHGTGTTHTCNRHNRSCF